MELCKFVEEFTRATGGAFPQIKFSGATYYKATNELTVKFLVSAFDHKALTENKASVAKIESAVAGLFGGIKTEVKFVKTYADEAVVRNKVLEYFNSNNAMIFRKLSATTLVISVADGVIRLEFRFDPAICKMLQTGTQLDGLTFALERSFMERTDIVLTPVEAQNNDEEEYFNATTAQASASLRLVEIKLGSKLYSKGKIENINQMPNYIADIKSAGENIVLCGRMSGLARRKYKNKKYDPNDPKSPEELPIISFYINDGTGKMETVCFPKPEEADRLEKLTREGDEVVCIGRVAISNYSGNLNYTVNAIFNCKIDFDSIHEAERMPVPERYETVRPKPYKTVSSFGFLDDGMAAVDEYMQDKMFVVFDLETTSTQIATTEIIEIGALKIAGGEITSFSTLVKPTEHIPEGATAVNHITDAMVAFEPPIEKVVPDFYKFADGAILVGHNIDGFDVPILRRVGAKQGYYFDNDTMDTFLMAKQLMPNRRSFSLENIARDYGFTHTDAHRALSDVEANFELFKELLRLKLSR